MIPEERRDDVVTLLEESVTLMADKGWTTGGATTDDGRRCIINTLLWAAIQDRSLSFGAMNDAIEVLDTVVNRDYSCSCVSRYFDGPIAHYNDHHCDGQAGAIQVFNAAIKELRG